MCIDWLFYGLFVCDYVFAKFFTCFCGKPLKMFFYSEQKTLLLCRNLLVNIETRQ